MSMKALRDVVARNNFVVLDTETTGLNGGSQIVQIAVIDQDGNILVDTLIKPTIPIPAEAIAIHRITNEMVVTAPYFPEIAEQLVKLVLGKEIIIYNAGYDLARIWDSLAAHGMQEFPQMSLSMAATSFYCAMEAYAEYWGEWNEWHQSYTWQSLTKACGQQGLTIVDAHNALGDCKMTLALIRKICAEADWLSEAGR